MNGPSFGEYPVTVDVHELEPGDRLKNSATPIHHITLVPAEGWLLFDSNGTVLTRRAIDARVQVWRGGLGPDDCPPAGIGRPEIAPRLTLVAR